MGIYLRLGHAYLVAEGGPVVADEACTLATRGSFVIPLSRTGWASSGLYGFPANAFNKPAFVEAKVWSLLNRNDVPVQDTANAVATIVSDFVSNELRQCWSTSDNYNLLRNK